MNKAETVSVLESLEPISLDAIKGVRLMNRIEIKYMLSAGKLPDLINMLERKYKVLEINNLRVLPYQTTYLDTDDFLFYNQHVRGELSRHKIRYRKYEVSGDSFLEIKKKTNKGRIIKWRIENYSDSGSLDANATNFVKNHLALDTSIIKPILINYFTRATLAGLQTNERITIDFNISFSDMNNEKNILLPYLAIVELKKEGYSQCSEFNNLLKKLNIHPSGFSKYCTGSVLLIDSIKKNMVKPKLLQLNRIENEYIRSYNC